MHMCVCMTEKELPSLISIYILYIGHNAVEFIDEATTAQNRQTSPENTWIHENRQCLLDAAVISYCNVGGSGCPANFEKLGNQAAHYTTCNGKDVVAFQGKLSFTSSMKIVNTHNAEHTLIQHHTQPQARK